MKKTKKYNSRIIIACDLESKEKLYSLINKLKGKKLFLKLGMQILYKEGFDLIKDLQNLGHNIFIDLKIHDIPNTAKNAIKSLIQYSPDFITIHTLGGKDMMSAIAKEVEGKNIEILGVTMLTSLDQKGFNELNIFKPISEQVEDLIKLAKSSGLTHIVCSAQEASIVKKHHMISITPGIRLKNSSKHDQKRFYTPQEAFVNGSDFIVVGREIINSTNPLEVYEKIERMA